MSYQLYITRADHWLESDANPIGIEEWTELIRITPELQPATECCAVNPKTGQRISIPLVAGAMVQVDGWPLYLDWHKGRIRTSFALEALPALQKIAKALNARLMTEDGENVADLDAKR